MNALRSPGRLLTWALALVAVSGCSDGSARTPPIDESVAGRLVGTWNITLTLERPLSLSTDTQTLPRMVSGTVALLEVGSDPMSFEQMHGATHMGVFRVDLTSVGLPPREAGVIPDVAARVVVIAQRTSTAAERDSVYLILNPETTRYSMRLSGTFDANSASGIWTADSFRGGGGTFIMHRR